MQNRVLRFKREQGDRNKWDKIKTRGILYMDE